MAGLRCGIVGLPNVGKSTFFNLIAGEHVAPAENYPFCTIEPHSINTVIPDERLATLAQLVCSKKTIYAVITMVDIAGLIEGASKGEGLGNAFLKNIESCDVLLHMVRCFEHPDVTHVMNRVAPIEDIRIINGELLLADMQTVESRLGRLSKKATSDKKAQKEVDVLTSVLALLNDERKASDFESSDEESLKFFKSLNLLTAKPMLYVCNVADDHINTGNKWTDEIKRLYGHESVMLVASKLERDIMEVSDSEERKVFMEELGLKESSLNKIVRLCYKKFNVHSFFTIGPQEARAWTIPCGASAYDAAGEIHTDFQKGFIRAEVIACNDYIKYKSEQACKNAGVLRSEGADYIVRDGDVIHFRFNV